MAYKVCQLISYLFAPIRSELEAQARILRDISYAHTKLVAARELKPATDRARQNIFNLFGGADQFKQLSVLDGDKLGISQLKEITPSLTPQSIMKGKEASGKTKYFILKVRVLNHRSFNPQEVHNQIFAKKYSNTAAWTLETTHRLGVNIITSTMLLDDNGDIYNNDQYESIKRLIQTGKTDMSCTQYGIFQVELVP